MSVDVSLDRLRDEIASFRSAPYLLTVSDDARPHCVSVSIAWHDDEIVMGVGNRTKANAAARPSVSLLWPPDAPGGYSLIVDATVSAVGGDGNGDNAVTVVPTRAVLHRPAASAADAGACGSDGEPVLRT